MYSVSLLVSKRLIVELLNQRLPIRSKKLIVELENLMLSEKTVHVVIERVLLHIGLELGLQKVSNNGRTIAMMQQRNLFMIGRGQLLISLDKVCILAH